MGGSAFSATLPASAFPRIPPVVYRAVKDRLTPRLLAIYSIVSTPYEAPEKNDHGDLDFLVCEPLTGEEVPHEKVQALFDAKYVVPMPGNRTSSYAVPIDDGEWAKLGHAAEEEKVRRQAKETDNQGDIFYQVDVHVCADKAEWERIHFFHGYGDLGMIMGLIARNKGLALGSKGLKIPHPPHPPFDLSENMDEIIQYMGLSMARWNAGFQTKKEVFEWVGASPLFDLARFRTEGQGIKKVKPERKMYAQFVEWVNEQQQGIADSASTPRGLEKEEQVQHALEYFGKKEQWDTLEREEADKARVKQGFSGSKVKEWTGLPGERWQDLKNIMDQVRAWVGGEPGILKILNEAGEEGIKQRVLQAKEKLGVTVEVSKITEGLDAVTLGVE
ncbi:hypothetical protein DFH08DRAFT_740684 [Mycena albidolilacea]|uniref:Uncharacterized protein n=1 Tax=Mycena albidolilacea TaxID=1033008 RepID=A0AAD7EWB1_9AGAR|nr:hypothetical protein DFH08DRAFT_740684 [Mycena albidolilacea]